MLALGAYLLAENPDAMAMLREDPASVDRVVEELLRHLTVVQLAFLRFAKRDLELGGQQITAGRRGRHLAARRQPRPADGRAAPTGDDASTRTASRPGTSPSATACTAASAPSWPAWSCASPCARLAQRFPDLAVTAPRRDLDFRKLSAVYGVEALPVRLYGADRASARV